GALEAHGRDELLQDGFRSIAVDRELSAAAPPGDVAAPRGAQARPDGLAHGLQGPRRLYRAETTAMSLKSGGSDGTRTRGLRRDRPRGFLGFLWAIPTFWGRRTSPGRGQVGTRDDNWMRDMHPTLDATRPSGLPRS